MSELEKSLLKTIKSDLTNVATGLSEVGVDKLLDNGLLKDIPILNTIKGVYATGRNIRDYIFIQKVMIFISELSDLSVDDREKILLDLENDSRFEEKVGEYLIMHIDRYDEIIKPKWLANAFKAYCCGKIDSIQLQRLGYAIDKISSYEVIHLQPFSEKKVDERYNEIVSQHFLNSGLASVGSGWGTFGIAHPNENCKLFIANIL